MTEEAQLGNAQLDRLVSAARGGDERAFHALFDATYRELRLFVGARADSDELVDEVVQAAFVKAFESLERYRPGGSFVAWLKGIGRNCLLQEYARRERSAPIALVEGASRPVPAIDDLAGLLDGCLGRLSASARAILELRYRQRLPVQDIAARLGRSPSSVSVSLFRLRKALAECLGPEVVAHV